MFLSSTTFGEFTFSSASKPLSTVKGFTRVAIWVAGTSKHALTACNCEGWMKGSSPWIFTTTSNSPPIFAQASRQRSVPLLCSVEVITTFPPNALTAASIRSSSVATYASSKTPATCSYTRCITVFPPNTANGLAGKRVDA